MKNAVTITYKGKTYKPVVQTHPCTKRTCSLYERGVCDGDADVRMFPCDQLTELLNDNGLFTTGNVCLKEVRT